MDTTKNRTHLTPEEVQEFIDLGVDFGETALIWRVDAFGIGNNPRLLLRTEQLPEIMLLPNEGYIPAPNLQEVLEVLPKQVKAKGGIYQTLRIECYSSIEDWSAGYGIEIDFTEINILDACTDLLRWVCKNHPETLIN